ncbi:ABC transporter substrate-binding protein [Nocardia bovistercoris]|uniref:Uncharacterized protein n=1 Tax=Nocardia bovistercoris TaxID=2785916 RepID=A0A931I8I7_9NOCA|nr:hypothetical protein [Nocardia bovistercoris]MBH0776261.1 hypothetical protein [Nocardia bovistercoris]
MRQPSLPMLCLVGPAGASEVRDGIFVWLDHPVGRLKIPRAHVVIPPANPAPDADSPIGAILEQMRAGLTMNKSVLGTIGFPRFRAAYLLSEARVSDENDLRDRLPELLRTRHRFDRAAGQQFLSPLNWLVQWIGILVMQLGPILRVWVWLGGLPGVGREAKWFMDQPFLSEGSENFAKFAFRLTRTANGHRRAPEGEVEHLLVNAFLSDLREAYRYRLWLPKTLRHTAFPTVILDGEPDSSVVAKLLERINTVRNTVRDADPLLVVAVVHTDPRPGSPTLPVLGGADLVQNWRDTLGRTRRLADPFAWYLFVPTVPPPGNQAAASTAARAPAPFFFFARRWVIPVSATIMSGVLLAGLLVWYVLPHMEADCELSPLASGIGVSVRDGQCVGYSDNAGQMFSSDPALRDAQREIFAQNEIAQTAHDKNPNRAMVTLVYFSGLTWRTDNLAYPRAHVDELVGLLLHQRRANKQKPDAEPLLRVVVANGGENMEYAEWVVNNPLADLVRKDASVLGVIGLDRSNEFTEKAITALGNRGVPTFATSLSANDLEKRSPLYFQAIPSNATQATLIADYARGAVSHANPDVTLYDSVEIFHPKAQDIYVKSLVDSLEKEFTGGSMHASTVSWSTQQELDNIKAPCAGSDSYERKLLVYAGRGQDFSTFLRVAFKNCDDDRQPPVLANDASMRFVTDLSNQPLVPRNRRIHFIASGVPVILAGEQCVSGGGRYEPWVSSRLGEMCDDLTGLIKDSLKSYQPGVPGDRTGLAYDVAAMFLDAARGIGTPSRAAVAVRLRAYGGDGVTGRFDFIEQSRIGEDKVAKGRIAEGATAGIVVTEGDGDTAGRGGAGAEPPRLRCVLMYSGLGVNRQKSCPAGTTSRIEQWREPR